ncbi:DUF2239 family protein [Acidomonas methanolica]|uniref:DUF2239 family protein n=1 Tax=Acidomonas methanolica TaxID=437 RepID=UPI002119E692|nr:DUF2239 family protein [Acidomonas methanolica]MCQ9156941.1 DUF2239 family protein [Acidomonas methanolica]
MSYSRLLSCRHSDGAAVVHRIVDLDLRGGDAEILDRISQPPATYAGRYRPKIDAVSNPQGSDEAQSLKTRGRPKLGVVAREVTLLPRQWEWLTSKPGGASATLRHLVDEARKATSPRQQRRAAQDAAYHFMQAIAGDLPGYEEATRALFADDRSSLENRIAAWPEDIRSYALRLAFGVAG